MHVEIRPQAFDPWKELVDFQVRLKGYGATSVFVGTMRDINESTSVSHMFLEHYPQMTQKHLEDICAHASANWDLIDCLVLHRVGDVYPSDPIVLVATWSQHRKDAYEANRFIMEDLKSKAPFWKKESLKDSHRWVEKNTAGY